MDFEYERRIGQNIKRLRRERIWSQDMLAAKLQVEGCDITRSALAKIEAGQRHIYADEIKTLKVIFNVKYEDLFE